MRNFLAWTISKRRRFNDILVTALSPTRRGPGSYQYRVKLKRRGPAVKHPPGSFLEGTYATVFFSWISCKLHTRMGSRNRAATPSAAARAPLIVVMHGTRYVTALRRMDFSSEKAERAGGGVDGQLNVPALQQIDRIGTAFVHLQHGPADQPGIAQRRRGAARGGQREAQFGEPLGHRDGFRLVMVVDADEDRALLGQRTPRGDLRLQERFAEVDRRRPSPRRWSASPAPAPDPRREIC